MRTLFIDWPALWADNPQRQDSEEHQIGGWWTSDLTRQPLYRLVWLEDTQELVLCKHGIGGVVDLDEQQNFALEAFTVPPGCVQVIGWVPRAEPPLPIDTLAQRHLAPATPEDNSLQRLKGSLELNAYTSPLA